MILIITPLAVNVVSNKSNGSINRNFGPCGSLLPMTDHYNDIKLYTPLAVLVVPNNSNVGMAKTYGPYSTLHSKKDHYIDIKPYTPFTIYVVSNILMVFWPKLTVLTVFYIL